MSVCGRRRVGCNRFLCLCARCVWLSAAVHVLRPAWKYFTNALPMTSDERAVLEMAFAGGYQVILRSKNHYVAFMYKSGCGALMDSMKVGLRRCKRWRLTCLRREVGEAS